MAFMKYSVLGGLQHSVWVGVDNFIHVLTDPFFPKYVLNTLLFVGLTLGMTFFAPIILALMLSEIPRGKVFFRMVYYLPTVTTGVVVALMWTEFFRGSPDGVLNRLSALFGINPIDWLGTPILAMACIIVPGVWAGMGPGCLIYLAALKSIPDDLYEAAELDGASLWQKIRLVTLPTIMPLIVINFLGSLLSTFHSSGNILLMTGGGPEGTTRVFSFMIWFKAFLELEYGQATAMDWVLGSALLGLMVVQLRLLSRVEFRRSTAE
jgi:multiple sugar transport system permease protein